MIQNIELISNEYIQVGSTNKHCIKVLPPSQTKKLQKFVVGDDTGTLSAFEFNKGDFDLDFKSIPLPKDISKVELAGAQYNNREKIFCSSGIAIRGYSRVGKEFFRFDSNLTETIKCFCIEETRTWTAGDYLLNEFEINNGRVMDKNYFLCPDKINDMFIHNIRSSTSYNPILACQDKQIRVLEGDKVYYSFSTTGGVNVIHPYSSVPKVYATKSALDKTMLFGLSNGSIINVALNSEQPALIWSVNQTSDDKKAGVSLLKPYDFLNRGVNDLVVCRDDSSIEFMTLVGEQEYETQYRTTLNEGITGIDAGNISVPGLNEFLISTYSGRIISFMEAEEAMKNDPKKQKDPKETEKKIKALRAEIDKYKQAIDILNTEKNETPTINTNTNTFKINYKIAKDAEDSSYTIHIESQYPMEFIALQSLVSIELLDVDTSVAILSIGPEDPDQKIALSATYRFLENSVYKFEVKLRTVEGQYGNLTCFVVPNANPKTCQVINIPIKPLSLHEKLADPIDENSLPLNTLKITGTFSKNEMHTWIVASLPDVPTAGEEDEYSINFSQSFVGTILLCSYKANYAIFKSDSISTITILKDAISNEASLRNKEINMSIDFVEDSIKRILELLAPKFEFYQSITERYQILTALKELESQDGNAALSKEYQEILKNSEEIQKSYKAQPKKLHFLRGIVTDLYVDRAKAKGLQNINKKMPALINSLANFDLKTIYGFFSNDK